MLDFTGPVTFAGPITVTNHIPDKQIRELVQALRDNTEAIGRDIMAKNKLMDELQKLETEMGELTTVGAGTNALIDRLITVLDSDDEAAAKVSNLSAALKNHKDGLVAANLKGTLAADEEEAEDNPPTPPVE